MTQKMHPLSELSLKLESWLQSWLGVRPHRLPGAARSGAREPAASAGPTYVDPNPHFEILALGSRSGIIDGNLSAYMIRPLNRNEAVLCDAGTVGNGLKLAQASGALDDIPLPPDPDSPLDLAGRVLTETIRAYCISHAHLDHVAGLVLTSPDDTPKPIYLLPQTRKLIAENLFNNEIWGNMGNMGARPALGKYTYRDMTPGEVQEIPHTSFRLQAWPLSHGNLTSTAFLLDSDGQKLLYLGDTQHDQAGGEHQLLTLWHHVAPTIRARRLHGLMIETTYPNSQPVTQLRAHLTPRLLLASLHQLADICGGERPLEGLNVICTHVKETFARDAHPVETIEKELNEGNDLGVHFLMARQGERYLV
ncbi:3',5'-cyclic-nucleotide phosphodiesterase [Oecophyllibacter saccharovorans]|uniref:MBL fold metallo-hydrolase n=1 Tax=Oecophyllibacter saccharovorans TaxID=2558360 RepID=UPI0011443AE8|nr:3',5'-cyclic-nucleotide phosphodiesterase [Oecophyllibacter saccharovorans]QDH15333.1 3',5'-cyclic-nucleotide phosphodiesterase [Oecophyllibacter saccharovorans]